LLTFYVNNMIDYDPKLLLNLCCDPVHIDP
jgi:hypothetical protein